MISRSDFNRLAKTFYQQCLSIYIPAESIGDEMGKQQGPRRLKAVLPEIKTELEENDLNDADIEEYLDPIQVLIEDKDSWRNSEGCMAVFLSRRKMEYLNLPMEAELLTYISDHFYLLPLIPLFSIDRASQTQKKIRKNRLKISRTFRSLSSSNRISADPNEIVPAAFDGNVEILFIQKSKDLFGLYDELNRSLIVDRGRKVKQDSLYNLAALKTWNSGGYVYLVEKDEMPLKGTSINALLSEQAYY